MSRDTRRSIDSATTRIETIGDYSRCCRLFFFIKKLFFFISFRRREKRIKWFLSNVGQLPVGSAPWKQRLLCTPFGEVRAASATLAAWHPPVNFATWNNNSNHPWIDNPRRRWKGYFAREDISIRVLRCPFREISIFPPKRFPTRLRCRFLSITVSEDVYARIWKTKPRHTSRNTKLVQTPY